MLLRARCPRCGRVEEYEPSEEELKMARERGVASISFFHGDHVLLVFFDKSGLIRRLSAIKVAGAVPTAPTLSIPLEELCTLFGREGVAYLLSAFLSTERLALVSSSTELALKIYQALREFSGLERPVLVVNEPDSMVEVPENAVLIVSRDVLAGIIRQFECVGSENRRAILTRPVSQRGEGIVGELMSPVTVFGLIDAPSYPSYDDRIRTWLKSLRGLPSPALPSCIRR